MSDKKTEKKAEDEKRKICGIVMPISTIDGCSESHWADVRSILDEAIESAGFEANIVSDADDAGIIHKRIIQNLYENPIVVCDVSAKNPNVMFELGMRLAFDKPTIIVKDDKTSYSFDTSAIEHLEYPRDLRFSRIVEFKEKLALKIKATYERAEKDDSYTTFLKHFGEFKVAKLEQKEVSGLEYVISELSAIRREIKRPDRAYGSHSVTLENTGDIPKAMLTLLVSSERVKDVEALLVSQGVESWEAVAAGDGMASIRIKGDSPRVSLGKLSAVLGKYGSVTYHIG
ncbi:hypothetical protein [Pseudomonas sediminis]|uniref:hypothetical protein n=1 Tax=Pseudomonas sediminis TaxID=1691904 RepID=UPI0017EE98B8|nr:hypothetical protein [Pseudomonas sediminis]